jgi:hypothetical protein
VGNFCHRSLTVGIRSQAQDLGVPTSDEVSVLPLLTQPAVLHEWRQKGLPSDDFSAQNAVIVTRSKRWPLLVDPQVLPQSNPSVRYNLINITLSYFINQYFFYKFTPPRPEHERLMLQTAHGSLLPFLDVNLRGSFDISLSMLAWAAVANKQ